MNRDAGLSSLVSAIIVLQFHSGTPAAATGAFIREQKP